METRTNARFAWARTAVVVALAGLLAGGCATTLDFTGTWASPDVHRSAPIHTLFVAALTRNLGARLALEKDLAKTLEAKGYRVVRSYDHFSPDFPRKFSSDREALMKKIRDLGADAILTVAVLNVETERRYVPGAAGLFAPAPPFENYRDFWGYYDFGYDHPYAPGYAVTDKTFFLESNLFDAGNGELLLSIQSQAYNPSNIDRFSQDYAGRLVDELIRIGALKP